MGGFVKKFLSEKVGPMAKAHAAPGAAGGKFFKGRKKKMMGKPMNDMDSPSKYGDI